MKNSNIQCTCGLCCKTIQDWNNHRQGTGHEHFNEVTIESLTHQAIRAIEGLKTFQKTDDIEGTLR